MKVVSMKMVLMKVDIDESGFLMKVVFDENGLIKVFLMKSDNFIQF